MDYNLPNSTPQERMVAGLIHWRQGAGNAIRAADLADALDIPERQIRNIVRDLRTKHYLPIGSTPSKPAGYFWAVTKEEILEFTERWRVFGLKQLYMVHRLRRQALPDFIDQLKLDLQKIDHEIDAVGSPNPTARRALK